MSPSSEPGRPSGAAPPRLLVQLWDGRTLRFADTFYMGREASCEVQIDDGLVSRRHAVVLRRDGRWTIRDLESSNGVFVDGNPAAEAVIGRGRTIHLGADGPEL